MKIRLTLTSSNKKTGPIPVSTSDANTCPPACPLKAKGCYAKSGPLALVWQQVQDKGLEFPEFCQTIANLPSGQIWRHNQAGDLPGQGDQIDAKQLADLVQANTGKRGFTYTHKPVIDSPHAKANREAIQNANRNGFTINLSANNLQHADDLTALNIAPVVVVLPATATQAFQTPAGRRGIICPAAIDETGKKSCATCQLCQKNRSIIIGFPAHGTSKKAASAIANG